MFDFTVARLANPPVPLSVPAPDTPVTTLLEAAAALETQLRDREREIQSLTQALEQTRVAWSRSQSWIATLRRSHRRCSHHETSRLFARAVHDPALSLPASAPVPR